MTPAAVQLGRACTRVTWTRRIENKLMNEGVPVPVLISAGACSRLALTHTHRKGQWEEGSKEGNPWRLGSLGITTSCRYM